MSALVLHFASGAAFFSGSGCLLVGLLAVTFARRKLLRASGRLLILLSLFLIGASATPLPIWAWILWAASLAFWLGSLRPKLSARSRWRTGALVTAAGC